MKPSFSIANGMPISLLSFPQLFPPFTQLSSSYFLSPKSFSLATVHPHNLPTAKPASFTLRMSQPIPFFEVGPFVGNAMIGNGSFATVWRARHTPTDLPVAIKVIPKPPVDSEEVRTRFIRETSLMSGIHHPFIAPLFHVAEDSANFYLVMEFVGHGNLRERINASQYLSESEARHIFCELVWVLDYLHREQHIVHRDLKCDNILFDRFGNIRLIDFGLSRLCDGTMLTSCGSPAYAAPELILRQPYTEAVDIWSLGVVLYGMTVGNLPFDHEDVNVLLSKVISEPVTITHRLSQPLRHLLGRMLCKDPKDRIGLEGIKAHPWFSLGEYGAMTRADLGCFRADVPLSPTGIDPDILTKMSAMGIDGRHLAQDLLQRSRTDATLVYDILRRQALTEKMGDIVAEISKGFRDLDTSSPDGIDTARRRASDGFLFLENCIPVSRESRRRERLPVFQGSTKHHRLSKPHPGVHLLKIPRPLKPAR
jgi:hypothetical protein